LSKGFRILLMEVDYLHMRGRTLVRLGIALGRKNGSNTNKIAAVFVAELPVDFQWRASPSVTAR
jgi:hypothetical protein